VRSQAANGSDHARKITDCRSGETWRGSHLKLPQTSTVEVSARIGGWRLVLTSKASIASRKGSR